MLVQSGRLFKVDPLPSEQTYTHPTNLEQTRINIATYLTTHKLVSPHELTFSWFLGPVPNGLRTLLSNAMLSKKYALVIIFFVLRLLLFLYFCLHWSQIIHKMSVYPGSHSYETVRSCQPRSTLLSRNTWTSHFWWRATSLTYASTSLSLPATRFAFFCTKTALSAWVQRNTMHPLRPTWWVTGWQ